jgi:general stress protein 26
LNIRKQKQKSKNKKAMKIIYTLGKIFGYFLLSLFIQQQASAQTTYSRDSLLAAAKDIITQTTYCGLITVDATGQAQTRTMNPFPVGDDFVVWFATSRTSTKVKELKDNPKVSVYFADHGKAIGYVNLSGKASVIDDKELLVKMKREYWNGIPNWQDIFVLIKIEPKSLQVINYKFGINNDPQTFRAPSLEF